MHLRVVVMELLLGVKCSELSENERNIWIEYFIYGLLNDAVSSWNSTVLIDKIIDNELENKLEEALVA